ncbi:9998_t:CDS:1, partial [Acaulospora morrowiae]
MASRCCSDCKSSKNVSDSDNYFQTCGISVSTLVSSSSTIEKSNLSDTAAKVITALAKHADEK